MFKNLPASVRNLPPEIVNFKEEVKDNTPSRTPLFTIIKDCFGSRKIIFNFNL